MRESVVRERSMDIFRDRREAGQRLARRLRRYAGRRDLLILALPRGGVPVAAEVARALRAPLDIIPVRKLGVPGQEELAFGAITSGGFRYLNDEIVHELHLSPELIDRVAARESEELRRRERLYRGDPQQKPLPEIAGRVVILIDDGIATGATMRVAIEALLSRAPRRIIVAVPVAAAATRCRLDHLTPIVRCVSLLNPVDLLAVGCWYADFPQVSDDEVCQLLTLAEREFIQGGKR